MEDFIPKTVEQTALDNTKKAELMANMELAKVTADQSFLAIIRKASTWKLAVQQSPKAIETTADFDTAINAFDEMKEELKSLETMRKGYVAFPTKVVGMVNGLFRTVRDDIEGSKLFLGNLIQAKKSADEEAVRRAQEEAAEKAAAGETPAPVEQEVSDGIGKVEFESPAPEMPANTVESSRGAKVHTRTDIGVEVEDLKEFLKVLVSKEERHKWLTDNVAEIVTINIGTVKRLLKENDRKKKVKGLKIEKTEKVV